MKLNINLQYKIKGDDKDTVSNQEVTKNYILIAVSSKYPQGLDGSYRRMFGKLMNRLDECIEKGLEEIELESLEFDFIKNAVRDSKFPAPMAYNANLLEDAIEQVK